MRMIELTDLMDADNETHVVVPVDHVAATIRQWYNGPGVMLTADTSEIEELQAALLAEDYETAADLAAGLAVGYDEVQDA